MFKEFDMREYQKLDYCGNGRFGKVLLYKHLRSNTRVAVKEVPLEEDGRLRIEGEVIFTSQFQGPEFREFFVQLIGRPYQGNLAQCLPLEYCEGLDLSRFLPRDDFRLNEQQIQRIVYYVATGLKKMHHRNVCHRDIKAENILLSSADLNTTDVKICDFGVARIPQNAEMTNLDAAPEMVEKKYDCRVDVWSLGVLTKDLLEGRKRGNEEITMAKQHDARHDHGDEDQREEDHKLTDIQSFIKSVTNVMRDRPTIEEALRLPFLLQWKNLQLAKFAAIKRLELKTKRNYMLNYMFSNEAKVYIQETITELEAQQEIILKYQYFEWPEVDVSLKEAESLLAINKFLLKVT